MNANAAKKSKEEILADIDAEIDVRQNQVEATELASIFTYEDLQRLYLKALRDKDQASEQAIKLALSIKKELPGDIYSFPPWPEPIDLKKLSRLDPQPPKFILPDWLPCGYATLFAGHGGIGKSGIALVLAICIATGLPFFGLPVERRRVLYLSCEDREEVLHWRLSRICAFLGVSLADLAGWLDVLDLVGCDTILFQPGLDRSPLTKPYQQLSTRITAAKTQVLFIDGISDTYDGNENARAEVKAFVNAVLALIPPADGAVVLVGHVAKMAANTRTNEGYSGSTAWHNAVRARWYLYPESSLSENGTERTGNLIMELQKSNLGPADRSMTFAWDANAGLFVGQETISESNFDRNHRERQEQEGIMAALRSCPDYVPAATSGQRTAYHVLSALPNFPDSLRNGNASRKRFWRLVEQLRAIGHIEEGSITRESDRKKIRTLNPGKDLRDANNGENGIRSTLHALVRCDADNAMPRGVGGLYSQQTEFEDVDLPLEVSR